MHIVIDDVDCQMTRSHIGDARIDNHGAEYYKNSNHGREQYVAFSFLHEMFKYIDGHFSITKIPIMDTSL